MSLRLDPRGLRSIEQVIADLGQTAGQLSPTDPRASKIATMIEELREIDQVTRRRPPVLPPPSA